MKRKNLLLLTLVIFAASCTTTSTITTKQMDIYGSGIIQYPVVADLEVSEHKVTGTAQANRGHSLEAIRNNAVADALKKADADVLIEPVFESVTNWGITTVTVTGFPGTYTNFRQATENDIYVLETGILQKATVSEPESTTSRFGNTKTWAALSIGLLVLSSILQAI
jgi:hypothetical protein